MRGWLAMPSRICMAMLLNIMSLNIRFRRIRLCHILG